MASSNKNIDDLEEEGRIKKEEKEKKIKMSLDKKNNPAKKAIKAAFNTSSFYNLLILGYIPKLIFACIYLTSFVMAFPYFRYFIKGAPVRGFDTKTATKWVLDPATEGYTLFWPFCILSALILIYIIIYLIAKSKVPDILKKEEEWAKSQPFLLENHPDAFGQDDVDRMEINIYYLNKCPDRSFMDNLANGINGYDNYYHKDTERMDVIQLRYRDSGKRAGYKMYQQLHYLIENVFPDIHKDYPIAKIVVGK